MKKLLLLLLVVFIGFGSLTLSAQSVTVANGTDVNNYIPMYGLWMDESQHNQIIYPESMLTDLMGKTVNTMMFFYSSEPSSYWTSTATLKVGTSATSSFSSATHNQSPVSQIYSGNINVSGGVVTFVLDSTFTYNGGNLLLDVTTVGGNYSSASFYGVAQMGASMYAYGSSSSGVENFIPKTMFVYGNCLAPTNVTVDSITQTSAMVTWQPGAQETDWEIFVGNGTEDLSTVTWIPLTSTSYEIQGLNPNTVYTVFVRANCGTEYSYEVAASFRTDCGSTLVPYAEGFESFNTFVQPICWQFIHSYPNYSYDYPTINDYQPRTGQHAMYFYTDYYNYPTQVQYAILPQFSEHITNLQLSLYSRRDYEYSGTFYIGYITDPTDESTFVPMVTRTAASVGDDLYHRDIVDFSNVPVDPDSTAYIAIGYQNSTYYGWYVDDIEVTLIPDCSTPVGLVATAVTTNSATLTWTPGTATTFNVYYKGVNDTAYTAELALTDTSLLIENLNHSSFYQWYVEAVCDDGSLPASEVVIFSTACAAIDSLPYFVDFETLPASSNLPYCWTRGNEDSEYPYVYMYESYAGSNSLYFYNTNTIAMPQIDNEELDIHSIQLSFYAYAYTSGTSLQVGVMTNPNVSSSFMPVGSPFTLTDNFQFYDITFASYTGNGTYIAFRNPDNWETIYLDNVTLDLLPECSRPESVWAQTLDSTSATIAWSSLDGQSGWEVVIGAPGFSPDTATGVMVNSPSHTFDNLTVNTAYSVYVRTDCGGEFSPWSNVMTFLTLSVPPATLPYACDFEDAAENALWTFVQNGQTNKWYIDSAAVTSDNSVHSMYISSDNGASNSYDITASSVSWAYRDIQFTDADEFELSFDWKGEGESSYDYMRVYIGNPASVTEGDNSQPTGSTQLAQMNQSSNWQHASFSLGASYKNSTKRLYFMWRNDYTMGTDPAAAVDNISITGIDCAQPYNVNLASVDTTSATISFTAASAGNDAWELMYGTSDTTMTYVNLSATSYQIDNLQPGTNYYVYVRTLCSSGDTSAWSQVLTFQTECVTINSVPRFWDFEANNIGGTTSYPMPACWNRGTVSSSYPYVYDYDFYAYNGSHYLYFYNSYKNLAIMPAIDTTVLPINTLEVSFFAKASDIDSYNAYLIVGVVSDIYNMNTFVPVDTIALTEDYPADPYVVMLNNYTGNGDKIAFKNYSSDIYAYNYIYLDDLTLEEVPNCLPISNLAMVSSDLTSITLNWTEGSQESSWNVEYKEVSDSVWNTAVATAIPFTLDNLTSSTMYDIRVQSDCGGDLSPWRSIQAYTQVCDTADQCEYTFLLTDSYGDGWNGGYVTVMQNGIPVAQLSATNHNLSSTQTTDTAYVGLCDGFSTSLLWHDSQYNGEVTITIIDPFGTTLHSINTPYQGTIYTFDANCLVPTCPAPTYIAVSNVDMNNATVTWTPGGDEANWNVEYKEASATTWTVVPVTATSYTINGLTAATLYDVRVQAECDPVNSNPSAYIEASFGTSVCAASDQCAYTFVLGDSYGDGWNGGYLDITQNGIVVSTITALPHGGGSIQSYDTLTVNLCNNLSTSLVWTAGSYASEASFTLIGPDGTQIYTYSDMSGYTTYTFTTDCGGAPMPTDPTVATQAASAIGQHTATLNATITNPDNVTITAKGFEWMPLMGTDYTQVAGTGTDNTFTANLSNLDPNTDYIFKAFITFDGTTVYGNELIFTTLPEDTPEPCDVPTGLDTTSVANETISITWNANSGVNSWNIQYRPQNGTWTSTSSSTNSYTITGLSGNTTYEIQIQAVCANGQTSDWSASLFVTTKNVGISNWLENSVSLYPNPAKEYVDIRVDGDVNVTAMEVYDVYGKLVNTVTVHNNPTRINVSGLADGMYFVRVTTEMGAVTKTFVKK